MASSKRKNQQKTSDKIIEKDEGIDYPLDIWFIISEYISPETVGKFASICKSSYYVVTTGRFWLHLYKRFYKPKPGLPERLQPWTMPRQHGLRCRVIRFLHCTYFTKQKEFFSYSQEQPHSLVGRRCCSMWHKEGKDRWYFFFKLKKAPTISSTLTVSTYANRTSAFLKTRENVTENPEEGCKVLRITCLRYSMLPPVVGLTLKTVSITLAPGFKRHRLQLGFGTSVMSSTLSHQIILNEVIDYQILDWWHPNYPFQHMDTTIQFISGDSWETMEELNELMDDVGFS